MTTPCCGAFVAGIDPVLCGRCIACGKPAVILAGDMFTVVTSQVELTDLQKAQLGIHGDVRATFTGLVGTV